MKYLKLFNESFDTKTFIEEIFIEEMTNKGIKADIWETSEYTHIDISAPNLFNWDDVKEGVLKLLNIIEFSKIQKIELGRGARTDYELYRNNMNQYDKVKTLINDKWSPKGNFGYLLIVLKQPFI